MLLVKEVEVNITGSNNIDYYENLGYKIPRYIDKKGRLTIKRGTKIKVKVSDLSKGSSAKVEVKCDCPDCNKPYLPPMKWSNYSRYVNDDGTYFCQRCKSKVDGRPKSIQKRIIKGQSFYDWCVENDKYDLLDRWNYELNKCSPKEVTSCSSIKYYFKCPIDKHPSEKIRIYNITYGKDKILECKACNSIGQYITDTYGEDKLNDYWDWKKNVNKNGDYLDPFTISKCCNKKIYIICQNKDYHESNFISCADFYNGNRCPYCANTNGKVHPKDSLGQYIIDNYGQDFLDKIWSDKNEKSAFEYTTKANQNVWWKCPEGKHEDYFRNINHSNNSEFRCPTCVRERSESILQEKVRLYLDELGLIEVLHEYDTFRCINPKTKYALPYDNEVIFGNGKHLLIEVNGKQHYEVSSWQKSQAKHNNTTPEYELHKRKLYDRYKRISAIQQGYFYLEIPYWTDDKEESWKQLIDYKINEILNYKEVI